MLGCVCLINGCHFRFRNPRKQKKGGELTYENEMQNMSTKPRRKKKTLRIEESEA